MVCEKYCLTGHSQGADRNRPKESYEIENHGEAIACSFIMYGLLTKCEVKMAGYWPSSFFACLWTETESRSINTQKKNEANIKPS